MSEGEGVGWGGGRRGEGGREGRKEEENKRKEEREGEKGGREQERRGVGRRSNGAITDMMTETKNRSNSGILTRRGQWRVLT